MLCMLLVEHVHVHVHVVHVHMCRVHVLVLDLSLYSDSVSCEDCGLREKSKTQE